MKKPLENLIMTMPERKVVRESDHVVSVVAFLFELIVKEIVQYPLTAPFCEHPVKILKGTSSS